MTGLCAKVSFERGMANVLRADNGLAESRHLADQTGWFDAFVGFTCRNGLSSRNMKIKKKKLFSLGTNVVLFLSAAGRILRVCMYMYSELAGTYRTVCIHMWINHRASPPYIYYTRVWSGRLCDDGSKIRM